MIKNLIRWVITRWYFYIIIIFWGFIIVKDYESKNNIYGFMGAFLFNSLFLLFVMIIGRYFYIKKKINKP